MYFYYHINLASRYSLFIVFMLTVLGSAGCSTVNTFPLAARAGDTIVEPVGSPEGMIATGSSPNTIVEWTPWGVADCSDPAGDLSATPVPITVRGRFNLYPEQTSPAWLQSSALSVEISTGHGPYTTVLLMDLPTTGLTVGYGCLNITTTSAVTYSPMTAHISDYPINLEILPGTGAPNPLTYKLLGIAQKNGDLTDLAPKRRIVIKPDFIESTPSTTYGAIEVEVTIPGLDLLPDPDLGMAVIPDEKIEFTTSKRGNFTWSQSGDVVKVIFLSPVGALEYYDAHFSILSDQMMTLVDAAAINIGSIMTTVKYYDIDGNLVGQQPPLTVIDET